MRNEELRALLGFESYDLVKSYHKKWVDEHLVNGKNIRDKNGHGALLLGAEGLLIR